MSLDGILHLEVQDHPFSGEEFGNFIEGILGRMQPFPLPNSVLVMDNTSIHIVSGIWEMIEGRWRAHWSLYGSEEMSSCVQLGPHVTGQLI